LPAIAEASKVLGFGFGICPMQKKGRKNKRTNKRSIYWQ
jgi:hypothetical protein